MKKIIFQVIDWRTFQDFTNQRTIIQIFGKTEDGKSVMCEIYDFKSYFYIRKNIEILNEIKKYIVNIHKKINNKRNDEIKIFTITDGIKSKLFNGFHGEELFDFVKISSSSYFHLKKLINVLIKNNIDVYETNKDILIQFIHDRKIEPCGWIELQNFKDLNEFSTLKLHNSTCDYHILTLTKYVFPANNEYKMKLAPFKICAYDIETISSDNGFPQARRKKDKIVSIASTFSIVNKECYKRIIFILSNKKFELDENNEVIICKSEKEIIEKWCELIIDEDPDIMTQWNGFGFDDNYIHERVMRISEVIDYNNEEITNNNNNENIFKLYRMLNNPKCNTQRILKQIYDICSNNEENDKTFTKLNKQQIKEINNEFPIKLSRFDECTEFVIKNLSSAALGDSTMRYYDMKGRCCFDLMREVKKIKKLISYKLDYVASNMFRDEIKKYEYDNDKTILSVDTKDLHNGQYIIIIRNDGSSDYETFNEKKFKIEIIDNKTLSINEKLDFNEFKEKGKYFVCNVKDDVKPKEIFEKYRSGNIQDLKELSLYNIQDCELCNKLCNKLMIIGDNIGMGNVCFVPLNWIFNRGQSPKVYSLVSKKCLEENYKILTTNIKNNDVDNDDEDKITYEGALVVDPIPGIYDAIFCLDYHALYPSSMICKNISHETYLIGTENEIRETMEKYKDEYDFNEIVYLPLDEKIVKQREEKKKIQGFEQLLSFNNLKKNNEEKYLTIDTKVEGKEKKCYFAVRKDGKIGLLPEILTELLENRENVKKQMAREKDPFKKGMLNSLQLAYKVTCNSVYGQLGCNEKVGPIALMDLAACTTATGRLMLGTAKNFATKTFPMFIKYALNDENKFMDYCNELLVNYKKLNDDERNKLFNSFKERIRNLFLDENNKLKYLTKFTIAYGDTDSIFVNMNLRYINGIFVKGVELRDIYMKAGNIASDIVNGLLPHPEELEYEKVLSPFISMAKKRYVGNFYTKNPVKPDFQYNMGFVLKRRDNARIVKYVIGGVVDKLLNSDDLDKAKKETIDYVKKCLDNLINGKYNLKMFVFSKSLKRNYKNRDQIAHAILADRIGKRDPGNKPAPNDRIDFAYIKTPPMITLQGDKIETPDFIKENKLKIDYGFYITNQLMVPCCQIIGLYNKNIEDVFNDYVNKNLIHVDGKKEISFKDLVFKK